MTPLCFTEWTRNSCSDWPVELINTVNRSVTVGQSVVCDTSLFLPDSSSGGAAAGEEAAMLLSGCHVDRASWEMGVFLQL